MNPTATLPDVGSSFQLIKIVDDLRAKADKNTLRGMGIVLLLDKNENKRQVISIIKTECLEYPDQMAMIIGQELVTRIINFE